MSNNHVESAGNKVRGTSVIKILGDLKNGKPVDPTPLTVNRVGKLGLGFNDGDLGYWMDWVMSEYPELELRRSNAMAFMAKTNLRASRDGGRMSAEDRRDRDDACIAASNLSRRMKAIEKFYAICVGIVEQREIERAKAAAAAKAAKTVEPAKAIEPAKVTMITPEIVQKPIVMKRRPKGLKKTAQCRGEITFSEFGALKEYQENTAMFSEAYHGE